MNWLINTWYKASVTACLLYPLSIVFRLISAARRFAYRKGIFKTTRFDVPVIVVGNITVGGTGKSPLVIHLIELLRTNGYTPGVVSRGYGGSGINIPNIVTPESLATIVGDEAVMIVARTGVPMVVCRDRVAAVSQLLNTQPSVDVIISDDGLQHYAMARDIEIVVVDGERRFGNGWMLPAGPLREPEARLAEVEMIVANGKARRGEFAMHLMPDKLYQVMAPDNIERAEHFKGHALYAVAGIGNPNRFFQALESYGLQFIKCIYPDHYRYTPQDLDFALSAPIIMTEKDAVKCRDFADKRMWCLPVTAVVDPAFDSQLLALLNEYPHPPTSSRTQ